MSEKTFTIREVSRFTNPDANNVPTQWVTIRESDFDKMVSAERVVDRSQPYFTIEDRDIDQLLNLASMITDGGECVLDVGVYFMDALDRVQARLAEVDSLRAENERLRKIIEAIN